MRRFIKNKRGVLILILSGIFAPATLIALEIDWPALPGRTPLTEQSTLPQLIQYFYEWAIALGGLAVFISLVYAGFRYLTSVGNAWKMKDARDRMTSAVLGLVLLLSAWLILNTINPQLTDLVTPSFGPPAEYLKAGSSGVPFIGGGGSAQTYQEGDDFCQLNWPSTECTTVCATSFCPTYGYSFGLTTGAKDNPGLGKDAADCTCYGSPADVKLAEFLDYRGGGSSDECECRGNASPQCGDFCFDRCVGKGHSFGTVATCAPGGGTDEVICACFDAPDIRGVGRETIKTDGELCECRGEKNPHCGEYCMYYCTREKGYDFGTISSWESCYNSKTLDVAWCTCMNFNTPPEFSSSIPDQSVDEGTLLYVSVFATDRDGDPLNYSASDLPSGATFNPSTLIFEWRPANDQAGNYLVTFKVEDSYGDSDEITINIAVNDVLP